jgi:hypothetical protein
MPTRIQKPRLAFLNRPCARGEIVREDLRRRCRENAGNCRPKRDRKRRTCHRLGSISKDPIGFAAGDVNQYRYVGNGPTNATDPSGLAEWDKGGHHVIPRAIYTKYRRYFRIEAYKYAKGATINPVHYVHNYDPWLGVKHSSYSEAVGKLLKEYKSQYSPNCRLTEKQVENFAKFLLGEQKLAKLSHMTDEIATVRTWMKGFLESIAHAEFLKEIDGSLKAEEMKDIVKKLVNEGKSLDDIPRLSRPLRTFRGLSKSARYAKYMRFVKMAGPALAALGAMSSTQQAVACEGPLAERNGDLPVHTRIVLQLGYDSVFGDVVEEYILYPAASKWSDFWANLFGLGGESKKSRQIHDELRRY